MDVIEWMRDSDPALRWQVERDLAGEPEEVWRATRARVPTEGFGARLLALQDADGQWAGGAFFPADFRDGEEGQPWTATTWSLKSLREWGVDASLLGDTAQRLDRNSRWEYEDLPYWGGEVDCCINGWTIANGAWLGADVSGIADWFLEHRMDDGGWNCDWVDGSTVSSFHSTLNALVGILAYEKATGASPELREARLGAQEYLLRRRLLNRLSTGEVVGRWVTAYAYPTRWRYTALRAIDYFLEANEFDGAEPDPRMAAAVEAVRAKRQPDGTWLQETHYPGREWFAVDVPPGEPSKWVTFTATRALRTWDLQRA